jgi:hypothetical protein
MPKKTKKATKTKKSSKSNSNSNVNKINININSGKTTRKTQTRKNKNVVSNGSTGSGKGGNGVGSGVSTGGLNGTDNIVQRPNFQRNDNMLLISSIADIKTQVAKQNNTNLLTNTPQANNNNNLLMDRLDRVEQDSNNTKKLIEDGYKMVQARYNQPTVTVQPKQNTDYNIEELKETLKKTPLKKQPSLEVNSNVNYQNVSKGKNKYRVSVKNNKTKIEKYNPRTNTWITSNAKSLETDTETTKSSLAQIKQNLMGDKTVSESIDTEILKPEKEEINKHNPLTTPSNKQPSKEPDELPLQSLKMSASKQNNPLDIEDDVSYNELPSLNKKSIFPPIKDFDLDMNDYNSESDYEYANVTIRKKPRQKKPRQKKAQSKQVDPFSVIPDDD